MAGGELRRWYGVILSHNSVNIGQYSGPVGLTKAHDSGPVGPSRILGMDSKVGQLDILGLA